MLVCVHRELTCRFLSAKLEVGRADGIVLEDSLQQWRTTGSPASVLIASRSPQATGGLVTRRDQPMNSELQRLLLAGIGLYGVLVFAVTQPAQEDGSADRAWRRTIGLTRWGRVDPSRRKFLIELPPESLIP